MITKYKRLTGINWGIFILIYLLFSWWHGAFETALSPSEVDHYINKYQKIYPDKNLDNLRGLLEKDNGKPLIMVNAIKLYDKPIEVNGIYLGNSSEEVLERYSNHVVSYLIKRGSYPLYSGTAINPSVEVWGIANAKNWTSAALLRYRSMRTFIGMATKEEFQQFHKNKIAAIEKTMAYPTEGDIQVGSLGMLVFFIFFSLALLIQILIEKIISNRNGNN